MACGCPPVGCRIGGAAEVIDDGETGVLVPPGDAPALAAALIDSVVAPPTRGARGARPRGRRQRYSVRTMVERTLRVLRGGRMRLAVGVTIQSPQAVELAQRPIAGCPWLERLVRRLRRARCVTEIVVVCRQGEGEIGPLSRSLDARLIVTDDVLAAARDLDGGHDAVAFCEVGQLFADPARLDELASLDTSGGQTRALAVLASEPSIALTGGPFLEAITRDGLREAADGTSISDPPMAALPSLPGAPEMRLESAGDMDWAVRAEEALLARHP